MRILVTGATGLLGSRLVPILLKAGHSIVATSRDPATIEHRSGVLPMAWNGLDVLQVPGKVDAIVHLAGEPIIQKRWSDARKRLLQDSRVGSTRRLVDFIARRRPTERPKVFVCASAVGYYGLRPEGPLSEESPPGEDFLAQLCRHWEEAAASAECRTVVLRFGHALSKQGGYLGKMLPLARLGLAGPLGGGRQPMPWVHLDDACGVILWALTNPQAEGAYNVTGPEPATQKDFVKALNAVHAIPSLIPVPGFALRLRFGEVAGAILGGQDARPNRLLEAGYEFGHPALAPAVRSLVKPKPPGKGAPSADSLARASADHEG